MDLRLTPEQLQLRDATRRLLVERLAAIVERLPEPPVHDLLQAVRDAQALGWLGLGLPESAGGVGGFGDLAVVHEELGRGLAPSLLTTLGQAARLVLHCDPGPVRDLLLGQLCEGSVLAAPALGEVSGPATTMTATAGGLRLDGHQRHVVDARTVSHLLVSALDETGAVQLLLVPTDARGVELEDEPGMADVPQCRLTLSGVVVADKARLTADATAVLRAVRAETTALAAARAVGGGRAVLDRSVDHVRTRHQFGRPIGTFQAVQHQLADVATALDAASLAVARAAWAVESGADQELVEAASAVAALAAGEAFAHATLVAHQLHGGMGFVLDSPLHLWSARAVTDPTAPSSRRHLLDALGSSLGLAADGLRLPAHHRAVPAGSC